jgi:hypothetical protein
LSSARTSPNLLSSPRCSRRRPCWGPPPTHTRSTAAWRSTRRRWCVPWQREPNVALCTVLPHCLPRVRRSSCPASALTHTALRCTPPRMGASPARTRLRAQQAALAARIALPVELPSAGEQAVYVNAKQYECILRRRRARAKVCVREQRARAAPCADVHST